MDHIKIPFIVTHEERSQIKESYLAGIESADEEKIQYIKKNLPKVIQRLKKSDEKWLVEIASIAEHLAQLLKKHSRASKSARKEIVAALYYLCHPFEVIPDYVPGRGYADDALVLNACLTRLRQRGIGLDTAGGSTSIKSTQRKLFK